jgi:hypothetical protein
MSRPPERPGLGEQQRVDSSPLSSSHVEGGVSAEPTIAPALDDVRLSAVACRRLLHRQRELAWVDPYLRSRGSFDW